jgi:hypothetical protein
MKRQDYDRITPPGTVSSLGFLHYRWQRESGGRRYRLALHFVLVEASYPKILFDISLGLCTFCGSCWIWVEEWSGQLKSLLGKGRGKTLRVCLTRHLLSAANIALLLGTDP